MSLFVDLNVRYPDVDDDQSQRLAQCLSGHPSVHTELTVRVPCSDHPCGYCKILGEIGEYKSTGWHRVTYTVLRAKGRNVVHVELQKPYAKIPAYARYRILVSAEQAESVATFLRDQLNKPFNKWGYRLNFTCLRTKIGCRSGSETAATKWFCSELCAAALQHAKILTLPDGVHPCQVSPGHFAQWCARVATESKDSGDRVCVIEASKLPMVIEPGQMKISKSASREEEEKGAVRQVAEQVPKKPKQKKKQKKKRTLRTLLTTPQQYVSVPS